MKPCPSAKKHCSGSGYTLASSPWQEISPGILTLILVRIPAEDLIRVIQFVCKSWKEFVASPYCWTQIEIESWCHRVNDTDRIEKVAIDLVRCSQGICSSLSAFNLTDSAVSFVLHSLKCLKVLKIPMSDVTDNTIIEYVDSLKRLTLLDINCCDKLTSKGVEALGKNCTLIVELRRNFRSLCCRSPTSNDEALVIAETMSSLQHLEVRNGHFTILGLDAILTKCRNLVHLDIDGCDKVEMEIGDSHNSIHNKLKRLVVFTPPWHTKINRNFSFEISDDDSDEVLKV